jgi:hypothetical protein
MRRATVRIVNKTKYRSAHLRAFVLAARDQVFGDDRKALLVTFLPSRARLHGRASIGGSWSTIWLPANTDKHVMAQILVHEFAHNAGAKGERWMRHGKLYGFAEGWRENVAWATALPLELAAPKSAPAVGDAIGAKLQLIDAREKAWRTKAKRAATALKKLSRRRTYYQRKLAATEAK